MLSQHKPRRGAQDPAAQQGDLVTPRRALFCDNNHLLHSGLLHKKLDIEGYIEKYQTTGRYDWPTRNESQRAV